MLEQEGETPKTLGSLGPCKAGEEQVLVSDTSVWGWPEPAAIQ